LSTNDLLAFVQPPSLNEPQDKPTSGTGFYVVSGWACTRLVGQRTARNDVSRGSWST